MIRVVCAASAFALSACNDAGDQTVNPEPVFGAIQTELLDGDLVRFKTSLENSTEPDDIADYANCAAAGYTLIRGYGFARHVRTAVQKAQGVWYADAVYTISPNLPAGLKTIDAEITARDCRDRGIPLV